MSEILVLLVVLLPPIGTVLLAAPSLAGRPLSERGVERAVRTVLSLDLAVALALLGLALARGAQTLHLGRWYGDAEYALELVAQLDPVSAGATVVASLVALVVLRFSEATLHREPGHLRFFATALLAVGCVQIVAMAGTLDLLFVGWELLGLCSFLLIAFFHEREGPVRRALRAILSYRVADLGLLLALVLLHDQDAHPALGHGEALPVATGTAVGLLLLLTAAGKAGMPPLSRWLARCAEGPTPSTALFYAGLSTHAAPWLLLRAWPLYGEAPVARGALVAMGLLTAVTASLSARARSDAKGAVVLASSAQVGLVVAEIGLGLHGLALLHMVGNLGLRTWQILRAPGALADARRQAELLGGPLPPPRRVPRWLWLWASSGFVDPALDRAVAMGLGLGRALDAASRRVEGWTVGGRDRGGPT